MTGAPNQSRQRYGQKQLFHDPPKTNCFSEIPGNQLTIIPHLSDASRAVLDFSSIFNMQGTHVDCSPSPRRMPRAETRCNWPCDRSHRCALDGRISACPAVAASLLLPKRRTSPVICPLVAAGCLTLALPWAAHSAKRKTASRRSPVMLNPFARSGRRHRSSLPPPPAPAKQA